MMNHHTMPKYGFGRTATGSFFLPRIGTKGQLDQDDGEGGQTAHHAPGNTVSLELCHGNNKQLITLPAEKLDNNKRYYVTFTLKDDEINAKRDITSLPPAIALCKGQKWRVHTLPMSQSVRERLWIDCTGKEDKSNGQNSAFFHLTERHADFIVFVWWLFFSALGRSDAVRVRHACDVTWRIFIFTHRKKNEQKKKTHTNTEHGKIFSILNVYIIICLHQKWRRIWEQKQI